MEYAVRLAGRVLLGGYEGYESEFQCGMSLFVCELGVGGVIVANGEGRQRNEEVE